MTPKTAIAGLLCLLGGCSNSATHAEYRRIGDTPALLTTADLRLATERKLPGIVTVSASGRAAATVPERTVICTEPSPDVAKALSTLTTGEGGVAVSVPIAGAVINAAATGAGGRSTAEQLAQLTERVPTIQALRDGLFRACEAYGNQAIGRNAYALILSRYGELLTTLLLAETAAGDYGHTLALLEGRDQTGKATAPTPPTVPSATPAPASIKPSADAGGAAGPLATPVAALETPVANQAAGDSKAVVPPRKDRPGGGTSAGSTPTSALLGAVGNNLPAAVEQMQFNYFKLNHLTPMLLLCANNNDLSIPGNDGTSWPNAATCTDLINKVVQAELSYTGQQRPGPGLSRRSK